MKKTISWMLVIFILITSIFSLSSCNMFENLFEKDEKKKDSGFSEGSGTEEDPYIISTAKHLKNLANKINDPETYEEYTNKHYKMIQNIDLEGEEWTPIGSDNSGDTFFQGVFDGSGYTVSNFKITNSTTISNGLFGSVSGTIKNLNVSQFEINFTHNGAQIKHIGGIAGEIGGSNASLENCSAEGKITVVSNGILIVGGVIGRTYSLVDTEKVAVKNCNSKVSVTAESTIENATFESIGLMCGSFAGSLILSEVTNCTAVANVKATSKTHGSYVGVFTGDSSRCSIKDCFAEGNAEMIRLAHNEKQEYLSGYLGGLCGNARWGAIKIERCFFKGDLKSSGVGNFYLGGIAGAMDGSITDSFAIGTINLNGEGLFSYFNANGAYVGGLVGVAVDKVEITNSYAASNITALYTENYMSIGGLAGGSIGSVGSHILLKNCISASDVTANCTVTKADLPNKSEVLRISSLIGEYPYEEYVKNTYSTEGQNILGIYNSEQCQTTDYDKNFPIAESFNLSSSYFYMETLLWDRNVWDLSILDPYSGKYPTLLSNKQQ